MTAQIDFSQWIPIFPLPNAVLMPRAVLPLHVFEPRYVEMTGDALSGSRLIAIALLKPGYEKQYESLSVDIHMDVCVGRILREEKLEDGRFNFLLQGITRAKVVDENRDRVYRRGHMQQVEPLIPKPEIEYTLRRDLRALLSSEELVQLSTEAHWLDLFNCTEFSLSDILDVLGSATISSTEEKQSFLAEPCVSTRALRISNVMRSLASGFTDCKKRGARPRAWPPDTCDN